MKLTIKTLNKRFYEFGNIQICKGDGYFYWEGIGSEQWDSVYIYTNLMIIA